MVLQINQIVFVFWAEEHNKHGFYYKAIIKRLNIHSVSVEYINYPSWGACTIPRKNIRTTKPIFGVAPGEDADSDDDYPLLHLAKTEKTTCIEPAEVMQPTTEDLPTQTESTEVSESVGCYKCLRKCMDHCINCGAFAHKRCSKKDIESNKYMCLPCFNAPWLRSCWHVSCKQPSEFACPNCNGFFCDFHFDLCFCVTDANQCNKKGTQTFDIDKRRVFIASADSDSDSSCEEEETEKTEDQTSSSSDEDDDDGSETNRWRSVREGSDVFSHPAFQEYRQEKLFAGEPLEYFCRYFNDSFLSSICEASVLNAKTLNIDSKFNVQPSEMKQFIGIALYMSIIRLGATRRYWHVKTRIYQVADTMSRARFEEIKSFLHFPVTENSDRLQKFQSIIDNFNEAASNLQMDEHLAVDEQIIAYKGRYSSLKQYNPKKPYKWGFKLYALCGTGGLIHKVTMYGQVLTDVATKYKVGKSGQDVLQLAQSIPFNKAHKLYFDNYFNSPGLQCHLAQNGIFSVGTLRVNRAAGLILPPDKEMKKKGRGAMSEHFIIVDDQEIRVVKWFDNRPVVLMSSFSGKNPVTTVRRFNKKTKQYDDVPIPNIVAQYNTGMGYVDEINSYLGRFKLNIRCLSRYYLRIFFHFVNLSAVNSWLEYRRDCKDTKEQEVLNLHDFKTHLAESLTKANLPVKTIGRPSLIDEAHVLKRKKGGPRCDIPVKAVRLDGVGHFPGTGDRRQRCKHPLCTAKPITFCIKCEVFLCVVSKDCFLSFHGQ